MRARCRRPLLAILAALPALVLPRAGIGAGCGDGGRGAASDLPTPEQLEQQGARIGAVAVDVEDIFDPATPGESAALYRWANNLHLQTREEAIRSQLLFSESEPFSRQKVEETERVLRGRRYLFDAWIEPTCYDAATQTVDVHVRVRDVWSLNPGFNFSRKGGANDTGFKIQDEDFLGRGELVSVSWGRNVDRDTLMLVYDDPQLLGSWWRGKVAYSDNSDGSFGELQLGRPFYSLDTRWSAGTRLAAGDRVDSRYQLGKVLDAFTEDTSRYEIYGGRSAGLRDGWARRWIGGVRYERSEFSETPDTALVAALPEDRTLVYPWVGMEWIENDFATARNQDQLVRTEDLQFGRSVHAELGLAAPVWGADRTAAIVALQANAGRRLGSSSSLFVSGNLGGRIEGDGLRIGNARSGLGNVLHIDLAVPLASQPGIDSVQLLVETRHSF